MADDGLRPLARIGVEVAATAEGTVDEDPTGVGREKAHGLLKEHRDMASRSACGIAADAATHRHFPVPDVTPDARWSGSNRFLMSRNRALASSR